MTDLFNWERVSGVCEKICYFFVVNLLFVVSNIPLLLFFLFIGIGQVRTYLPLFLLCMFPMAPALSAVFYAMNRLIGGVERGPIKDYWKGYTEDLIQKLLLGTGQLFAVFVLWTNVEFFALQVQVLPLTILFGILFAAAVLITPNLYMLASRYEMKNLQIVKTAIVLLFARPGETFANLVALAVVLMAFELSPGTTVLFAGSVYGFLIMFMNKKVIKILESR